MLRRCRLRYGALWAHSGGAGEPTLHGAGVDEAGLLELQIAAREDGEIRNALDVVAGGEFGELLGVDLEDDGLACEVVGDLGHMRCGHAAGAAPGCPEIDEDGDFAVADDLVELRGADGQRLGDGRQRLLAGAAAARVGEVIGGDSVGFSAGRTVSDHRLIWMQQSRFWDQGPGSRV